jgi:hypothetical protein
VRARAATHDRLRNRRLRHHGRLPRPRVNPPFTVDPGATGAGQVCFLPDPPAAALTATSPATAIAAAAVKMLRIDPPFSPAWPPACSQADATNRPGSATRRRRPDFGCGGFPTAAVGRGGRGPTDRVRSRSNSRGGFMLRDSRRARRIMVVDDDAVTRAVIGSVLDVGGGVRPSQREDGRDPCRTDSREARRRQPRAGDRSCVSPRRALGAPMTSGQPVTLEASRNSSERSRCPPWQ